MDAAPRGPRYRHRSTIRTVYVVLMLQRILVQFAHTNHWEDNYNLIPFGKVIVVGLDGSGKAVNDDGLEREMHVVLASPCGH